jgi:predicted phosphodiesterase
LAPLNWSPEQDDILVRIRESYPDFTWAQVAVEVGLETDLVVTADMARNRYNRVSFQPIDAPADPAELRVALQEARDELSTLKASKKDFGLDLQAGIAKAVSVINVPPVGPVTQLDKDALPPESAVLLLSDWQTGKKTPSYSTAKTVERVEYLFDQATEYIRRHPAPIEDLHILMLGDLVEGDGAIFKGQAHEIDSSLFVQVFTVANLLVNGIRSMLTVVPEVYAEGIAGNHGVINRESHPESNADCFAMETARLILQGQDRLEFPQPLFPGHSHWHSIHDVRGLRWFLMHGDQIRSQPGQKAGRDKMLGYFATLGGFEFAATGHYHSSMVQDVGNFQWIAAGSTESGNEFAREKLATGAQAGSQYLLFQDADGLTAQHQIRLP